ncbi:MAG: hypothetical protein EPN47_21295 [Acidobacteria bacterium]|nr:MAG: hypothetical protein EPN47_21295 [Acidobacteriota bacterium]
MELSRGWAIVAPFLPVASIVATPVSSSSGHQARAKNPSYVTPGQFTTAHPTVLAAAKDYFDIYPTRVQWPIAFTHRVHLKNGVQCTGCHKGVAGGPGATIPNVQLCVTRHQVIATDKPEVNKVAEYQKKGEQIPWQCVYGFHQTTHVKFKHGPHIRAGRSSTILKSAMAKFDCSHQPPGPGTGRTRAAAACCGC